jgi:hypothetical protein
MSDDKIVQCYDRYRMRLQHEDMLLNQRVTWIVTSQSFLLGSYVFLLNSTSFFATLDTTPEPHHVRGFDNVVFDLSAFVQSIHLLRRVFQVVGLASAIATCISALAAVLVVRQLTGSYRTHLLAMERVEHPADSPVWPRQLPEAQKTAALARIHEREGLPALVGNRLHRGMGLLACGFFGVVFAVAWLLLIVPAQHLAYALPLILLVVAGVLSVIVYKLSNLSRLFNTRRSSSAKFDVRL